MAGQARRTSRRVARSSCMTRRGIQSLGYLTPECITHIGPVAESKIAARKRFRLSGKSTCTSALPAPADWPQIVTWIEQLNFSLCPGLDSMHLLRIATERSDIVLDKYQGRCLVMESVIEVFCWHMRTCELNTVSVLEDVHNRPSKSTHEAESVHSIIAVRRGLGRKSEST